MAELDAEAAAETARQMIDSIEQELPEKGVDFEPIDLFAWRCGRSKILSGASRPRRPRPSAARRSR